MRVKALFDARTEADLMATIFRRGLELAEAQALAVGLDPPPDVEEQTLAARMGSAFLAVLPLIRKTGILESLGLANLDNGESPKSEDGNEAIDADAAGDVTDLGSAFL